MWVCKVLEATNSTLCSRAWGGEGTEPCRVGWPDGETSAPVPTPGKGLCRVFLSAKLTKPRKRLFWCPLCRWGGQDPRVQVAQAQQAVATPGHQLPSVDPTSTAPRQKAHGVGEER